VSDLVELERVAQRCEACTLAATRTRVVFSSGPSSARLVLIGEAPGAEEDRSGVPFIGRSGVLLMRLLSEVGLEREALYVTNVVKCRPPKNRTPRRAEAAACRPFLEAQLAAVHPRVVVALGATATRWLLGGTAPLGEVRGRARTDVLDGTWVVPTYHPAAALRGGPAVSELLRDDLALAADLLRRAA